MKVIIEVWKNKFYNDWYCDISIKKDKPDIPEFWAACEGCQSFLRIIKLDE